MSIANLVNLLKENGYAINPNTTLLAVYNNTARDYSPGAWEAAAALSQYIDQYGKMTVNQINLMI